MLHIIKQCFKFTCTPAYGNDVKIKQGNVLSGNLWLNMTSFNVYFTIFSYSIFFVNFHMREAASAASFFPSA